ncbi:MAG TPA: type IV secretory system conjugative DNA transfer family protein, partial [Devosia sp.]|nr:type IV secretory system conjugative DNA transfer family protein [Devosia sp.]
MTLPALPGDARRHNIALGTAQWVTFAEGAEPVFAHGQVFMGHLPSANPIGMKDDSHCLVCARTRMGKGTTFIVPNILYWPGSLFAIDPKGENAMVTARQRGFGSKYVKGMKQKVYLVDPFKAVMRDDDDFSDLRVGFNPLDLLRPGSDEIVDDAGRIADALIVSENQSDPFWDDAARMLVRTVILHVATWPEFAGE